MGRPEPCGGAGGSQSRPRRKEGREGAGDSAAVLPPLGERGESPAPTVLATAC